MKRTTLLICVLLFSASLFCPLPTNAEESPRICTADIYVCKSDEQEVIEDIEQNCDISAVEVEYLPC